MKIIQFQEKNQEKVGFSFPIWQISFPICLILVMAILALMTVFAPEGQYNFNVEANHNGVKITSDVDKRVPIYEEKTKNQDLNFPDINISH